jgi:Right handed beta helix region
MRTVAVAAVCLTCAAGVAAFVPARSITTCDAANPFDTLPDDVALQACLDNYDAVLLQPNRLPGYVGYLVSNTIKIKHAGTLLTSAAIPAKATIVAAPALDSSMLRASGVDAFEISFIRFDGNRENRLLRDKPCNDVRDRRNVELIGNGFNVRYIESAGAVCGSGMTVGDSSDFTVSNSLFYDNGRQPEDAGGVAGLWADGLTVFKCINATIRDNAFWDNTDVDLGVNGGSKCAVYRNTITHSYQYAFAGLVIGDPTRSGGEFSDNLVSSGYDLLGFGIIVGCHPWSQCGGGFASDVNVHDNRSFGAVVNFAVDGLNGGSIRNNTMRGAQGSRLPNCPGPAADYTVGHAINVGPLQTGYVVRIFDVGLACGSRP